MVLDRLEVHVPNRDSHRVTQEAVQFIIDANVAKVVDMGCRVYTVDEFSAIPGGSIVTVTEQYICDL